VAAKIVSLPLQQILGGKYEILEKIAEGGIGSLYKVRHQLLEEVRVIKILRAQVADRDDLRGRLMQEAKTAIKLEHPNIARFYDLAVAEDGTAYIVMEYIDGVSLDALLQATGPPSLDLALAVGLQALEALDYLHDHGFIHRDISPDNLMLTRDRKGGAHVKLIDLGIAKDLAEKSGVTAAGTFLGKVKYCAPELFTERDGATKLDQRSDNYSLGITLYELMTGVHPYSGDSFEELAAAHLFHPPRSFDESDPEGRVPGELRQAILGALAKNPDERPATAGEFAERLRRFPVDEAAMRPELERTVAETRTYLGKVRQYRAPGSTQAHFDEQFGMGQTGVIATDEKTVLSETAPAETAPAKAPAPPATAAPHAVPAAPAAKSHARIPWLVAAGGLAIAAAALLLVWLNHRQPLKAIDEGISGGPAPLIEPAAGATSPLDQIREKAAAEAADVAAAEAEAVDEPPRPVEPIEPDHPKPDKEEVVVLVSAFVDTHGDVTAVDIKAAPTFKRRYREAALAAVEAAEFVPGTKNGEPAAMWVDVLVRFKP
jgi:eukaryotic-like serine/threonine-protein kinase